MTETKAFPRFQTSYMVGPLQVVVRDDDAGSFVEALERVGGMVPVIDAVGEKINPPKLPTEEQSAQAEKMVADGLNGRVIGRTCAHGEMTYREGVSQSTQKPYKGWFCPQRTGGCNPIFVR